MAKLSTEPELFHEIIKQIHISIRVISSYPLDHPNAVRLIEKAYQIISNILDTKKILTIHGIGEILLVNDVPIESQDRLSNKFASDLSKREITSLTFSQGVSFDEFKDFLSVMAERPDAVKKQGGVAIIFKQKNVAGIKINEIKYGQLNETDNHVKLETKGILEFLSGQSDYLESSQETFFHLTEHEPEIISELIRLVAEATDITASPYNIEGQAKAAGEAIYRMARQLIAREGMNFKEFKSTLDSVLSNFDNEMLTHLARDMTIIGEEKREIIDHLSTEFFFDTVAENYIETYLDKGETDKKIVKSLLPTQEEQKRIWPYLEKKLKESGRSDKIKIIKRHLDDYKVKEDDNINLEGIENYKVDDKKEKLTHEPGTGEPAFKQNEETDLKSDLKIDLKSDLKKETEEIKKIFIDLLSQGKTTEAQAILSKFYKIFDDKSVEVRQQVAESFSEILSSLDEFDKLKECFQDTSNILINKLKNEDHIDTYLILADSLKKVCNAQNKVESYFVDETLGSRLLQTHKLTKTQLQQLLLARRKNGKSLQYNFGILNYADESVLNCFLAEQYKNYPIINLSDIHYIPDNVLAVIPVKFIKKYLVLPFKSDDRGLMTAMENPRHVEVIKDLQFIAGRSIIPFVAGEYYLIQAIEKYYNTSILSSSEIDQAIDEIAREEDLEFIQEKEEESAKIDEFESVRGPVVRLVNLILKEAIAQRASDIHIEPYEHELRIRFRIDGSLVSMMNPPYKYKNAITSRIKIMSQLNISEKRLPQDGRFKIKMEDKYVDIRVSTFPGSFGEKVVLRVLDKSNTDMDISKLGLKDKDLKTLTTAMYKSKGMIMVTGPTGSGKTTTLYSMLQKLNDGTRNITTAEDPIEYNVPGINQFQINPKIGLDFAKALRSFLRQDPDIIMVGEIRDIETAQTAVKAALTGHLVLSTLHTNSAVETIIRLLNMGIEPFLVASSINLIIAQRLMRKICPTCKAEVPPGEMHFDILKKSGVEMSKLKFYSGKGCSGCNYTGYKERMAIYELLPMSCELSEMIIKGESLIKIKNQAEQLGLEILTKSGLDKVTEGLTTLQEWLRVVA